MRKTINIINKILEYLSIFSIGAMLLTIFIQVLARYVFHHSLAFSEELARYLFVYTAFFGTAVVSKNDGHIVMEALTSKLKKNVAKYAKIVAYICTIIFVIILFCYGIRMMVISSLQLSPALRISMSFVYFAIPSSAFVMLCNLLLLIHDTLKNKG